MGKKIKQKKGIWFAICPKCGSKDVTERGMIGKEAYSKNLVCLTCGFQSPIFPEVNANIVKKFPDKQRNFITTNLPIFVDRKNIPKWLKLMFFSLSITIIFYVIIMTTILALTAMNQ